MEPNDVTTWSILPKSEYAMEALVTNIVDLVEPPTNENGVEVYPFKKSDGTNSTTGEAEDREEIISNSKSVSKFHIGSGWNQMWFSYDDVPSIFHIYLPEENDDFLPAIEISHPWEWFSPEDHINNFEESDSVQSAIDVAIKIHKHLDSLHTYGFGSYEPRPEDLDNHPSREAITEGRLDKLRWLNVIPSRTIDNLGRDRVLSAPAFRVEELENGDVLLVVQESPLERDLDKWDAVRSHLGLD